MSLKEPAAFYGALRRGLLGPALSPQEVAGTAAVLRACEGWPISHAAYALATAYHETAHTMQPVTEYGGEGYFRRMYDPHGDRPHIAARLGNTMPGDGARFAGRGYVQLTGRANYARAAGAVGLDLIGRPKLAARADVAALILRSGMAEGWFTGRSLADLLPAQGLATRAQFKAARRIINGVDRDILIAGYADQFQSALAAGGWDINQQGSGTQHSESRLTAKTRGGRANG